MGYAHTLPYSYLRWIQNGSVFNLSTITSGDNDYSLGDITTPQYVTPLSYCFVELSTEARQDTSGAANYLSDANLGEIQLNDGVNPLISCGVVDNVALWTPASGVLGEGKVELRTNIASLLLPNTSYSILFKHGTALANNLLLFHPRVNLIMYFGV